jgi:hypothetical protein
MTISGETLLNRFLRTYRDAFSARELSRMLANAGVKASVSEAADYLESDPLVFPLEQKMYMTRSGAFTGQLFSFMLLQTEIEQRVFVPGDRCMPFVDNDMLSCFLHFEYNGVELPRCTIETDCNTAVEFYTLYGDEYASQYIAADPVNKELNLVEHDFELPPRVKMTAVSLDRIIDETGFTKGDRLLCRVRDWDKGIVELYPVITHKQNPYQVSESDIERQKWNTLMENALLDSFDRMGPCASMEEQLANVFYEHRRELCTPQCGSIIEFLMSSKKVSMELFGVETRLWRKGEDVPAVGNWNKADLCAGTDCAVPQYDLPDYVIDSFITDELYEKKDDISALVNRMLPDSIELSLEEKKFFTLHIISRNDILRKKYNWFADFVLGSLRHRALDLYAQVGSLVYKVDLAGNNLEQFPQQELVTLSQLFTHITHILDTITNDASGAVEDADAIQLSLEGMEYNFEDIQDDLSAAADELRSARFKII